MNSRQRKSRSTDRKHSGRCKRNNRYQELTTGLASHSRHEDLLQNISEIAWRVHRDGHTPRELICAPSIPRGAAKIRPPASRGCGEWTIVLQRKYHAACLVHLRGVDVGRDDADLLAAIG